MFRAQIVRRSFSLFKRVPESSVIKSATRDGHESFRIQRVRFKRRVFTRSRMIGTAVIAAGAYGFLQWLDDHIEDDEEEHSSKGIQRLQRRGSDESPSHGIGNINRYSDDDDDDDEEEAEGLIFFPTGFSRPKPKTFYKSSDPEWQEFVRLAQDRQRIDRIRGELVTLVRSSISKTPMYTRRLGNINVQKGSTWLEVRYPDGPPTEFERPGVELTEDLTFRKSTRPVHQMHHQQLLRLMFPTAVTNSLYLDSKKKMYQGWLDLKRYLGWNDKPAPPDAMQQVLAHYHPSTPESPAPTSPTQSTSATPPAREAQKQSRSSSAPPSNSPAYERLGIALPNPVNDPVIDLSYFRQLVRRQQKPKISEPPRGTFLVSGLIQVVGSKANATVDIIAAYDPKVGKYVGFNLRVRSITDYQQRARGDR